MSICKRWLQWPTHDMLINSIASGVSLLRLAFCVMAWYWYWHISGRWTGRLWCVRYGTVPEWDGNRASTRQNSAHTASFPLMIACNTETQCTSTEASNQESSWYMVIKRARLYPAIATSDDDDDDEKHMPTYAGTTLVTVYGARAGVTSHSRRITPTTIVTGKVYRCAVDLRCGTAAMTGVQSNTQHVADTQ